MTRIFPWISERVLTFCDVRASPFPGEAAWLTLSQRPLTADADHVLLRRARSVTIEHVSCAFSGHRRGDRPHHVVVAPAAPHHVAQADRVVVAEARMEI